MNKAINCPSYEGCDAAICPLEEDSVTDALWYPDEGICRSRKFSKLSWLKTQKKIARLSLSSDIGYFTVNMFELIDRVSRGIKGVNPDKPDSRTRWVKQRKKPQGKPARIALFV